VKAETYREKNNSRHIQYNIEAVMETSGSKVVGRGEVMDEF
jgi:hypothetical protein